MLDGLADDGQLAVGDVSGILASGTETVVHILVASCEDGFYAVAFGPSEGFDGLYKVENAFHRVAKTAKISLSTNEAQLDAAFGKVGEVAAVAVAGGHVVEVRVFTGFLRGKLQHAGAVMTIGTTIDSDIVLDALKAAWKQLDMAMIAAGEKKINEPDKPPECGETM